MFKIEGLDELQEQLDGAIKALEGLDGELTTLSFNPADPSSIEAAVAQVEHAIDAKVGNYRGNEMVDNIVEQMKGAYRQQIYDRAAAARLGKDDSAMNASGIDPAIFRQIENAVLDLQSADYQSFERPIKKLSRLLHSQELEPITSQLTSGIDLDAWIKAGEETASSMVGSAKLDWPAETEKELGTIILLIDRFAQEDAAINFSYSFFYIGNNFTTNLQNMTRQMLVPFARDYINYVKAKTGTVEATMLPARTEPAARKIFIVHGHDEGAREGVARFVERLGFEPIILHEQANQGKTVIEKIEAHSDVGFAVVLLTPDDFGGKQGEEAKDRARQNVLLELGYFVGRLGRARVCALKRGDLDVPSDFGGVVYVSLDDAGAWKEALGRELQAAGFDIDWNLLMRPAKN